MDEEREYNDEDVVTCSTGVTVKAGDEVTIVLVDGEPTVIASSSSEQTSSAAGETASYFWHDEQGAHVSEQPESTDGNNILIDQDSVDIRDGEEVMATFERDGVTFTNDGVPVRVKNRDDRAVVESEFTVHSELGDSTALSSVTIDPRHEHYWPDMPPRISMDIYDVEKRADGYEYYSHVTGIELSGYRYEGWDESTDEEIVRYEGSVKFSNVTSVDLDGNAAAWREALDLQSQHYVNVGHADGFSSTVFRVYRYGGVYELVINNVHPASTTSYSGAVVIGTIGNSRYCPSHDVYGTVKMPNHYVGRLHVAPNGAVEVRYMSNGTAYYSGTGSLYGSVTWVSPVSAAAATLSLDDF